MGIRWTQQAVEDLAAVDLSESGTDLRRCFRYIRPVMDMGTAMDINDAAKIVPAFIIWDFVEFVTLLLVRCRLLQFGNWLR